MIDDASVADSCGVFAWAAVFDGFHKDFDGVFARAEVDDFKRLLHYVRGLCFFAAVLARSHEVVYEAFDDVDARLAKTLMLMTSHTVGCSHWCKV